MIQRDATHHQVHKDDPAQWGDPQPALRPRHRRLAAMISVRFLPDEEQAVRDAAASRGTSVSRFIRQAALGHLAPSRVHPLSVLAPTRTRSSGTAVCWDDGRVDSGTFVAMEGGT